MRKKVSIRVNSAAHSFLKQWDNASFGGFVKEINGGLGECIIELAEHFDYTGSELKLGNIVDILVSDEETTTGDGWVLIYSGYISMYEPYVDGKREGIRVSLLGHYTKLSVDILKNSTQTTLYTLSTGLTTTSGSLAAGDVGTVMRAIVDRWNAENSGGLFNYSQGSIPTVSQNIKYTFEQQTYRAAIERVKSAAPTGYFWYVDAAGTVFLKAKDTTPKHTFIMGQHFEKVRVERSMEKIRNFLLIWDGIVVSGKYRHYQDDASIATYGRRIETLKDYGLGDTGSCDNIGNKFIAENKDPDIKVICEIMDDNWSTTDGYDIESVEPGDTCRFVGFDETFADIFRDNLLITKVNYFLDHIELTVELVKTGIIDLEKKTQDKLAAESINGVPVTYT